jgi:protocatechuate 3,4-dioxygenase beta subunit
MIENLPKLSSNHATLAETLRTLAQRRRFLGLLGGAGAALTLLPPVALACNLIEQETGGPYPGDGTNGPNVLTQSGIVRSDIRSSFGTSTSMSAGTLNTVKLKLLSTTSGCGVIAGLAVYIWHCDNLGRYSMYSQGVTGQNYLRGVQVTDANGEVTFTSVFPGCYSGRWPHIHIEVYASVADATNGNNALRTTQLAMSEAACRTVYAQSSYSGSLANLNATSLSRDNVFGDDGAKYEQATVTGDNANGYLTYLEVGVAVAATAASSSGFAISPAISGSWYDVAQSGQGFSIEILANNLIVVYFYTFDAYGNNVWLVGSGPYDGATASVDLYTTTGGFFPPNFDASKISHAKWGTLTLAFTGCNAGVATWSVADGASVQGYTGGSLPITRLTEISTLTCSA